MKLTIYLTNGKTLRFEQVQLIIGGIILEQPIHGHYEDLNFLYKSVSRPEAKKQRASFKLNTIAGYSYDFE